MATNIEIIQLMTPDGRIVRFQPYFKEAPETVRRFLQKLPIETKFVQARFAGEEIWSPEPLDLIVPAENSTINIKPGEIPRNDVGGAIAIAYGEAKLSDWVNLFGIVLEEDRDILKSIGETIWLEGARVLKFEKAKL
jgi:hypothetical protein